MAHNGQPWHPSTPLLLLLAGRCRPAFQETLHSKTHLGPRLTFNPGSASWSLCSHCQLHVQTKHLTPPSPHHRAHFRHSHHLRQLISFPQTWCPAPFSFNEGAGGVDRLFYVTRLKVAAKRKTKTSGGQNKYRETNQYHTNCQETDELQQKY